MINPVGVRRVIASMSRELDKAEAELEKGEVERSLVHYRMLATYFKEAGMFLERHIPPERREFG